MSGNFLNYSNRYQMRKHSKQNSKHDDSVGVTVTLCHVVMHVLSISIQNIPIIHEVEACIGR